MYFFLKNFKIQSYIVCICTQFHGRCTVPWLMAFKEQLKNLLIVSEK